MKILAATAVILMTLMVFSAEAPALVNMSLTEPNGRTSLERNSIYQLDCRLTPDQPTQVSQIYAYVRYRKDMFTNVSLTDQLGEVCPIIWETTYVNAAFEDDGTWITAQYLMANTEGEDWAAEAVSYLVYTLTFRVKADAPLESTNVNFTQSATISDDEGGNVTGTIDNYSFTVILDSTPPVTEANPAGGYYPSDRNIALTINETGTRYYRVGASGEYQEYTGAIPLTGASDTVTTHELYFYGVDEPVGKTPNQETPNLEVYHIDKEAPAISGIAALPAKIGMGGSVDISFDVADLSGKLGNFGRPDYVLLGGRGAGWVSGTDVGSFTYRLAVNGAETDGDVVIRATDAAGNFSIQTGYDVVEYDLDGPEFGITASPNPIFLQELLNLTITASEPLSGETPEVEVGGQDGFYDRHEELVYYYTYLMTSRNWEANFGFLDLSGDRDGDGLPDWWEIKFGLDPDIAYGDNGGAGDPDEDGWSNLQEYQFYNLAGRFSDPTDPNSGGQAIPLHRGWNLVSYTVNKSWYTGNQPTGLLAGVVKEAVAGNWGSFFSNARFKGSASNLIAAQVMHPGGSWRYYGQFQEEWKNTLDYISPDQGLWLNMAAADTLILDGPRVAASATYPTINLASGWNLVGILPQTCFYVDGFDHDALAPSDLAQSRAYPDVQTMIQAALNISPADFAKISAIQIMYPPPYGMKAYDISVPWMFWSLKFIQPGVGAWIRLKTGETLTLNYRDPE